MPKKRLTRVHSVKAQAQIVELTKAGTSIELEIFANKEKLGDLIIGRGSLEWSSRKCSKKYTWTRFASIMDYINENGLRIKKADENND